MDKYLLKIQSTQFGNYTICQHYADKVNYDGGMLTFYNNELITAEYIMNGFWFSGIEYVELFILIGETTYSVFKMEPSQYYEYIDTLQKEE